MESAAGASSSGKARRWGPTVVAVSGVAVVLLLGALLLWPNAPAEDRAAVAQLPVDTRQGTVKLSPEQAAELSVGPVELRSFPSERSALGIIDFDQDHSVQVFSPYQGRLARIAVRAGDTVEKGQLLYTVEIPDLPQAEATLVSAAGVLKNANSTLERATALAQAQSIPQKELQQATADQQTADANWRAARRTLSLFGLTAEDIEAVEKNRRVDAEMPVKSPMAGRVVARAAAPGLLVQPGSSTAPVTVSQLQKLWMVASVPESDIAAFRLGQAVKVTVPAYPNTRFDGRIDYIADAADPATHRFAVRADVSDPTRRLKPQMQASFTITLEPPAQAPGVPAGALVREGDGRWSAWVTTDGQRFQRRVVSPGVTQGGMVQVLEGLKPGERIAREKALFLSNLLATAAGG